MRKIILGMENCPRCKILKEKHPEAEYLELEPATLLVIARALDVREMPMVVSCGNVDELDRVLK